MTTTTELHRAGRFATPLGDMIAVIDNGNFLCRLAFEGAGVAGRRILEGLEVRWNDACAAAVARQIGEYFNGQRLVFDLPLNPRGTPFQQRVWGELRRIPAGTAISYGALAQRLGMPGAARAVGGANAANPLALIVPCHRVIGATGKLTGYAGGLPLKQRLLEFEAATLAPGAA